MRLLLIRHGETDWNIQGRMQGLTDRPLNSFGIFQAQQLAARLVAEERIELLYTSPLLRARRTAEIIGAEFDLEPVPDDRLVERSAGPFEGLTAEESAQSLPEQWRIWRESRGQASIEGVEPRSAFLARVVSFLATLCTLGERQNIAIVTHGGTLGMLLASLLKLDVSLRLPFRFDNASLTIVDLRSSEVCLRLLNDTSHLFNRKVELASMSSSQLSVARSLGLDS
jgi:broad specificity phosphatase PhoE